MIQTPMPENQNSGAAAKISNNSQAKLKQIFDHIARLAAHLCQTIMAAILEQDADQLWVLWQQQVKFSGSQRDRRLQILTLEEIIRGSLWDIEQQRRGLNPQQREVLSRFRRLARMLFSNGDRRREACRFLAPNPDGPGINHLPEWGKTDREIPNNIETTPQRHSKPERRFHQLKAYDQAAEKTQVQDFGQPLALLINFPGTMLIAKKTAAQPMGLLALGFPLLPTLRQTEAIFAQRLPHLLGETPVLGVTDLPEIALQPLGFGEQNREIYQHLSICRICNPQPVLINLPGFEGETSITWFEDHVLKNLATPQVPSVLENRTVIPLTCKFANPGMNSALLIIDSAGIIQFANNSFSQMLGYIPEELVGRSEQELVSSEAAYRQLQEKRRQIGNGRCTKYELELQKKTGESVWFIMVEKPIFDEAHRVIGSTLSPTEISEDKIAEDTLRRSEELHRITLSHITEAVFITDDMGHFTFICPNVHELFGYTVEEIESLGNISRLLGHKFFDRMQLEKQGEIKNLERAVRDKAGKRRDLLVNVKRVSILNGTTLYSCRDITERRKAEEALYEERERFRLLVESVKDYAIFMLDALGLVESWNAGAENITGYLASEIIGEPFSWFYSPEEIEAEKPWKDLRTAATVGRLEQEGWCVRRDGTRFWADVIITALRHKHGDLRGFSVVIRDFTERKLIQEQLWHAAFHDSLTGLPNRAFFSNKLYEAVEIAKQRPDYQFSVLFLDLDRFKVLNDSLGHSIGDQLLICFAHRLQTCLQSGDIVARLGGDEFAILLCDMCDISDATRFAEGIHAALKSPFNINGHEVFTTVSIGIAVSDSNCDSDSGCEPLLPESLLRDADTAMYRAKSSGRARHEVFNAAMHASALQRLQLETDLRRAMDRVLNEKSCEFALHYQPIVSLKTGRLAGFEALLRWYHPKKGFISPAEFIPIAEDIGLIVPLGQWILREASLQLVCWQQSFENAHGLIMNVNLSSKQLTAPNLIEQIDDILQETNLNPGSIKLEITESLLMENAAEATEVLEQLKARKIQLCIDDFGTGYSSLSYLHKLPVSTLKIDRSFINRLASNDDNGEIVRAIIMLAQSLGMYVVAEGIETQEQLSELLKLQCDCGQGYFFSKPLNQQEAEDLIAVNPQW